MREHFEMRRLKGAIKIKLKNEKTGEVKLWEGDKWNIVAHIVSIAKEYMNDGYVLTLRQLYYQLVARGVVPNHIKVYAKISSIKDDVVYSGLVDWKAFEDRGRIPSQAYYEHSVEGALERTINSYALDRQRGQENHIEVWTEKDAISSILKRATHTKTIRLVVNKGYSSSTAMYGAYERFLKAMAEGKKVKVLYFGDHDPSGIDMIRDIRDRIMFMLTNGTQFEDCDLDQQMMDWWSESGYVYWDVAEMEGFEEVAKLGHDNLSEVNYEKYGKLYEAGRRRMFIEEKEFFEVIPVGLTMDQINEFNPPPNPAKITDPRAKGYIAKFGQVSWEVDALKPAVMLDIVNTAIESNMDMDVFNEIMVEEKEEKNELIQILKDRE